MGRLIWVLFAGRGRNGALCVLGPRMGLGCPPHPHRAALSQGCKGNLPPCVGEAGGRTEGASSVLLLKAWRGEALLSSFPCAAQSSPSQGTGVWLHQEQSTEVLQPHSAPRRCSGTADLFPPPPSVPDLRYVLRLLPLLQL